MSAHVSASDDDTLSLPSAPPSPTASSLLSEPPILSPEALHRRVGDYFTVPSGQDASLGHTMLLEMIVRRCRQFAWENEIDFTSSVNRALLVRCGPLPSQRVPGAEVDLTLLHVSDAREKRRGAACVSWAESRAQRLLSRILTSAKAAPSERYKAGSYKPDIVVELRVTPTEGDSGVDEQRGHLISLVGEDAILKRTDSGGFYAPSIASSKKQQHVQNPPSLESATARAWKAKLARTILYLSTANEICGCRLGLLRIHDQYARLYAHSDKRIAIEVTGERRRPMKAEAYLRDTANASRMPHRIGDDLTQSSPMQRIVSAAFDQLLAIRLQLPLGEIAPELPADLQALFDTSQICSVDDAGTYRLLEFDRGRGKLARPYEDIINGERVAYDSAESDDEEEQHLSKRQRSDRSDRSDHKDGSNTGNGGGQGPPPASGDPRNDDNGPSGGQDRPPGGAGPSDRQNRYEARSRSANQLAAAPTELDIDIPSSAFPAPSSGSGSVPAFDFDSPTRKSHPTTWATDLSSPHSSRKDPRSSLKTYGSQVQNPLSPGPQGSYQRGREDVKASTARRAFSEDYGRASAAVHAQRLRKSDPPARKASPPADRGENSPSHPYSKLGAAVSLRQIDMPSDTGKAPSLDSTVVGLSKAQFMSYTGVSPLDNGQEVDYEPTSSSTDEFKLERELPSILTALSKLGTVLFPVTAADMDQLVVKSSPQQTRVV